MKRRIFFIFCMLCCIFSIKSNSVSVLTATTDSYTTFKISSGKTSNLLLSSEGIVYAWGLWGEDSDINNSIKYVTPTDISQDITLYDDDQFIDVICGEQHSFLLTKHGRLFAFGSNQHRQLIYSDKQFVTSLIELTYDINLPIGDKIVKVAAGSNFNVLLSEKHNVYTFGENNVGQLGIGEDKDATRTHNIISNFTLQEGDFICDIKVGADYTLALSNNGHVYGWGGNKFNQLGEIKSIVYLPTLLDINGANISKIACGRYTSYFLTQQNQLYGMGCNNQGQLGDNKVVISEGNNSKVPYLMDSNILSNDSEYVVDIIPGYYFCIVKTNLENLYSFGDNSNGQLANKNALTSSKARAIDYKDKLIDNDSIYSISCGQTHCIATSKYGHIYFWGSNAFAQGGEKYESNKDYTSITDITYNFPPIILLSVTSASVLYKSYEIEITASYLDDEPVKDVFYCISSSTQTPKSGWIQYVDKVVISENEGSVYLHVRVDSSRDSYYKCSRAFLLDHVLPSIKITDDINNEITSDYFNQSVFVHASDNASKTTLYISNNGVVSLSNESKVVIENDGIYKLYVQDEAGNVSEHKNIIIDKSIPIITLVESNILQSDTYSTRSKTIQIDSNENLSCYIYSYKGSGINNYNALNDNEKSFEVTLKKGINTIIVYDLAGNASKTLEIIYTPKFYQDSELLFIVFGSIIGVFIAVIITIYVVKSKKKLVK